MTRSARGASSGTRADPGRLSGGSGVDRFSALDDGAAMFLAGSDVLSIDLDCGLSESDLTVSGGACGSSGGACGLSSVTGVLSSSAGSMDACLALASIVW